MPEVSGFEVLKWIRQHPNLRDLRVVVLSGSEDMRDVDAAYKLGANSFLIKPADFERFVEISQALSGYWIWMDAAPEIRRQHKRGEKAENGSQPAN
jgi:DNA-binding NarL/FixJ family response regulator